MLDFFLEGSLGRKGQSRYRESSWETFAAVVEARNNKSDRGWG